MFVYGLGPQISAFCWIRAVKSVSDRVWNKESEKVWELFCASTTVLVGDPRLISIEKSRTVDSTACESALIRGSVSKLFLITPFERTSASIFLIFPLIKCHVLRVCYYCDYSTSILILLLFCKVIDVTYYLEVLKHIYSLLNVFTRLKNEISYKDSIKTFCVANYCFLPSSIKQESRKTATRHPAERSFRNRSAKHIFYKRTPPPSSHEFSCVHWGYKLLWISAVLPVS